MKWLAPGLIFVLTACAAATPTSVLRLPPAASVQSIDFTNNGPEDTDVILDANHRVWVPAGHTVHFEPRNGSYETTAVTP